MKTTFNGEDEPVDITRKFLTSVSINGSSGGAEYDSTTGQLSVNFPDVVRGVALKGSEGDDRIEAELDSSGTALLELDEIQFGELDVDTLYVDGNNIYELIPIMQSLSSIENIPDQNNLNMVVSKVNELLRTLKNIAARQK